MRIRSSEGAKFARATLRNRRRSDDQIASSAAMPAGANITEINEKRKHEHEQWTKAACPQVPMPEDFTRELDLDLREILVCPPWPGF